MSHQEAWRKNNTKVKCQQQQLSTFVEQEFGYDPMQPLVFGLVNDIQGHFSRYSFDGLLPIVVEVRLYCRARNRPCAIQLLQIQFNDLSILKQGSYLALFHVKDTFERYFDLEIYVYIDFW